MKTIEVKMKMEITDDSFDGIARAVNHRIEDFINLKSWPEIYSVYDCTVNLVQSNILVNRIALSVLSKLRELPLANTEGMTGYQLPSGNERRFKIGDIIRVNSTFYRNGAKFTRGERYECVHIDKNTHVSEWKQLYSFSVYDIDKKKNIAVLNVSGNGDEDINETALNNAKKLYGDHIVTSVVSEFTELDKEE